MIAKELFDFKLIEPVTRIATIDPTKKMMDRNLKGVAYSEDCILFANYNQYCIPLKKRHVDIFDAENFVRFR